MAYCEDYKSFEYQSAYIRNSLNLLICNPCDWSETSLFELIKKEWPDMIKGCHTNRVKKIIREWLPDAQSKMITKKLFEGII